MEEAIDKVGYQLNEIVDQTVVDALQTCDVDHYQAFIKAALQSALSRLLVSMLDDSSVIRESFKIAII